ncbi:MAG: Bug family tripartite tricarboxylate transporter substrate binding protein [Burkholderiales bacterium]
MRFQLALFAIAASLLPLHATQSFAQAWPQRPVRVILPLGPGSGADIGARLYADQLGKRWGRPVLVENRPGGDGMIAINAVLGARDDHTLLWGPTSAFVGHPYTLEKIPYDVRELLPVARVTSTVVSLAVPTSLNVGTLKEFMTLARERPGKFNWSSVTTITDIVMEGYFKSAGLDLTKVNYKDGVVALTDLTEGRIQMYSSAYAIVRSQAQAGRIKLLAVMNRSRAPGLDLPTVAELGFPGLNFDGLVGIIAARSSAPNDAARARIVADIAEISKDPAILERLTATAQLVIPGSGAEFAASITEQTAQLAATAKALGIKSIQ